MYRNSSIVIRKGGHGTKSPDIHNPVIIEFDVSTPIPANHILVRIDKFGFSANNVTYAALGQVPHFRYFEYFSLPKQFEAEYGITPVWGFATIVASSIPSISAGERVYGYLPMSEYALLPIESHSINAYNLYIPRPHLPPDRRVYNTLIRCSTDTHYRSDREDEIMIYRPLYWTSFWLFDYLHTHHYHGANTVLISSASSKTSFCLAYIIQKHVQQERIAGQKIKVIGFTSPSNMSFTRSLKLYDDVYTYNDVDETHLPRSNESRYLYVDVASNSKFNVKLLSFLEGKVAKAIAVGMTNVDDASKNSSLVSGQTRSVKLETFFMPEWLATRRKQLTVKQITEMQKRAWDELMEDCVTWLNMVHVYRPEAVKKAFAQTVEGKVGPEVGQVFSLFDNSKEQKSSTINLKSRL